MHTPALVSLVYIDGRWFSGLPGDGWLDQLQTAVEQRLMEPSDANALDLLLRCIRAGYCKVPEPRLLDLIATLASRYPANSSYPGYLARYYGETGRDLDRAVAYSQQAITVNPDSAAGYYHLASWYLARGERGQAALALGDLLTRDARLNALRSAGEALP
jgi:tetratricopeptide (TPR) repeat protein